MKPVSNDEQFVFNPKLLAKVHWVMTITTFLCPVANIAIVILWLCGGKEPTLLMLWSPWIGLFLLYVMAVCVLLCSVWYTKNYQPKPTSK